MLSWFMAAAIALSSPTQFDMRCATSYKDDASPLIENDSRYSVDLDRGVWCLTRQCKVQPFYDMNEAELQLFRGFSLDRSTGLMVSRQFNTEMQCRRADFTPMPTNKF